MVFIKQYQKLLFLFQILNNHQNQKDDNFYLIIKKQHEVVLKQLFLI
ncbi:hypothetical protein CCP3SC1AL1_1280009 [Gammaproteobacteria bacterium]